jgi:transglutaminase-like putative cysteine protease
VPPDQDWVDYFLFQSKQGYCDYFATAMVVLLRIEGVPARVASGFAPGEFDPSTNVSIVRENHAHSWVEVYFPRYGWITFEPSSIRPIPQRLEEPPQPVEAAPVQADEVDEHGPALERGRVEAPLVGHAHGALGGGQHPVELALDALPVLGRKEDEDELAGHPQLTRLNADGLTPK